MVDAAKLYVKRCTGWNATRMNLLSISLLLICGTIDSIGKLWVNFLCLNLGQLENLSSIAIGISIFLLSLPLFLDTSFLLLQRVHPKEVSMLIQHELSYVNNLYEESLSGPVDWHVWALDKSFRVGSFKVMIREGSQAKTEVETQMHLRTEVEQRMAKYCQSVTVQIY